MNVTLLESICKSKSRSVLDAAKHSIKHHPFVDIKINQGMVDDCINFQICNHSSWHEWNGHKVDLHKRKPPQNPLY